MLHHKETPEGDNPLESFIADLRKRTEVSVTPVREERGGDTSFPGVENASLDRITVKGDADLSAYRNAVELPKFLTIEGRAILSRDLIQSLHQDTSFRSLVFRGPIAITGAKELNESERISVMRELESVNGSEVHIKDNEYEFL